MSDLCYEWPVLNRIFRQAALMDKMMERVGVEPINAVRIDQGMAFYEARTKCIDCFNDGVCRRWLDCANVNGTPPSFCPNAEFFRQSLNNSAPTREAP
jgi:hypothetical protein